MQLITTKELKFKVKKIESEFQILRFQKKKNQRIRNF